MRKILWFSFEYYDILNMHQKDVRKSMYNLCDLHAKQPGRGIAYLIEVSIVCYTHQALQGRGDSEPVPLYLSPCIYNKGVR